MVLPARGPGRGIRRSQRGPRRRRLQAASSGLMYRPPGRLTSVPVVGKSERRANMPLSLEIGTSIDRAVDACAADLLALSRQIHAHPELRFEEHKASQWLTDFLVARGHRVERGLA